MSRKVKTKGMRPSSTTAHLVFRSRGQKWWFWCYLVVLGRRWGRRRYRSIISARFASTGSHKKRGELTGGGFVERGEVLGGGGGLGYWDKGVSNGEFGRI